MDLICTNQAKLAVDSVFHPSLYPNCHHRIIYCKFNLLQIPPTYECFVWNYKHFNENALAKALNQVDCNFLFFNKNVHEQVSIVNRLLMNTFSNFNPNELVIFNYQDPGWMMSNLRDKITRENGIYKDYLKKWQIKLSLY